MRAVMLTLAGYSKLELARLWANPSARALLRRIARRAIALEQRPWRRGIWA
jgi:hypothetical protein